MVKQVLLIAFHYPPQHGSSGLQRTLTFSRYLPLSGWSPFVLTAHPRAHASVSDAQLNDIPADVPVHRAFALDTARHLSIRGKYLLAFALPDRWSSWWLGAVPAALAMVRRYRPAVIWSTYPIATAHLIAYTVHRLTGVAWVADFRDPMVDSELPAHPVTRRVFGWIERKAMTHCAALVFSTPGAVKDYQARYPGMQPGRLRLIENGYDEDSFAAAAQGIAAAPRSGRPLRLIHSGIVYPSERDPRPLFEAIAALMEQKVISGERLQIILRGAVHETYLAGLIAQYDIGAVVSVAPAIAYRAALQEMLLADGLLVLQASNCNIQIPAKLYEYLRAQKPILALTDAAGDTARKLRECGIDTLGPLDDVAGIIASLSCFLDRLEAGTAPVMPMSAVRQESRTARSEQLAALLDEIGSRRQMSP